jgi:hypothetical protein
MGPRNVASETTPDAARHGLFLRWRSADIQYDYGRYADCESVQSVCWDGRGLVIFIYIFASSVAGVLEPICGFGCWTTWVHFKRFF